MAARSDLVSHELQKDRDSLRAEIRQEMHAFLTQVRQEVKALRAEMASPNNLNGLRLEVAGQMEGSQGELRTIKWMLGGMLALMTPMVGALIAIALA